MRRLGRECKQARADNGADTEGDQIERAQGFLQLMLAALAFAEDSAQGFDGEKAQIEGPRFGPVYPTSFSVTGFS